MIRFSNTLLLKLHRFLLEIHSAPDVEALRQLIPVAASQLISSDRANFNEFNFVERGRFVIPAPVPAYWERLGPVMLAHAEDHALFGATPQQHRALTFSDRSNDPAWKRSALYHEYYVPAGVRHQLAIHLDEDGALRFSLAFNRSKRDFSAEERALLELISPHVARAWRNARECTRLRCQQAAVHQPCEIRCLNEDRCTRFVPGLTHREAEILHWIGEGKRNGEIGTILSVSERTVGKHVEHILEKLGVETRTAAARVAFELRSQRDAGDDR